MPGPLVSILIPAYNAAAFVSETLESALAQTWAEKEIVVVDDGSSDATVDICRRYEGRTLRVLEVGENLGQTAALNRALREASGSYVQYLDADDVLAPDKIERQMERLEDATPHTLATGSWARFYSAEPNDALFQRANDYRDYDNPIEWLLDDWTGNGTMPPGAWLFPRDVVEEIGPWNEALSLNNDMEYFTRAVLASDSIRFCNDAKLYYRSGHSNLSGRRDASAIQSQYEVIRLSTERVLSFEDSARTRHAAACCWQSLEIMAHPDHPRIRDTAHDNAHAFGGGSISMGGSRLFRAFTFLFGWRFTVLLQRWSTLFRNPTNPNTGSR